MGLLSLHHCMSQALIMDFFVYICIHPLRSVSWRTLTNPRRIGGGGGGCGRLREQGKVLGAKQEQGGGRTGVT